jgi:hypothetical protein
MAAAPGGMAVLELRGSHADTGVVTSAPAHSVEDTRDCVPAILGTACLRYQGLRACDTRDCVPAGMEQHPIPDLLASTVALFIYLFIAPLYLLTILTSHTPLPRTQAPNPESCPARRICPLPGTRSTAGSARPGPCTPPTRQYAMPTNLGCVELGVLDNPCRVKVRPFYHL